MTQTQIDPTQWQQLTDSLTRVEDLIKYQNSLIVVGLLVGVFALFFVAFSAFRRSS